MHKLVFVLLALGALAAFAGTVHAGSYFPPPGDCCPQWSPHGTQIVFETTRSGSQPGPTVGFVAATGGPEHFVPGIPAGTRSPDWTHVAAVDDTNGTGSLTVWNVDGTGKRVLAQHVGDFAWSPDSQRIAFTDSDDALAVIGIDGAGLASVAPAPAAQLAWSPDGTRIAYQGGGTGPTIHVVRPDGTGDVNLTPGTTKSNAEPAWSPDSTRLAFWTAGNGSIVLTVERVGGDTKTYRIAGASATGAIVWAPGGKTVYGAGGSGLVGITLATGERRTLVGIGSGVFSPDGTKIAYAAGGECRDRDGIYVANADGTNRRRATNSCRVVGTPGPDVLHGSFSQVVLGLGGNDTLLADDTYYFFDGNTLYGGPGDDTLIGKGSIDILNGGPGQDHIDGGGGGDVIYAVDGQRDWITCGKNGYGKGGGGRDVVYADQIDVVASDCEIVHRSAR